MDLALVLRAVRRARRMSQRELAERAGVPRSTVDRIESGRTSARFETIAVLLAAAGFDLLIVDWRGRLLEVDSVTHHIVDRAGRRFPAHLPWNEVRELGDDWWGWFRIAWWKKNNPLVPDLTYHKLSRPRLSDWERSQLWLDAT
jgi:transcriptional regulator with XRE-family HTH domain